MKTMFRSLAAAFGAAAVSVSAFAHEERCEAIPKTEWKPQAELEKKLVDSGWKVKRVKIENGCYEVYGTDDKGAKAEVFFHPKTLERVVATKK
jgi:hypothetical protein